MEQNMQENEQGQSRIFNIGLAGDPERENRVERYHQETKKDTPWTKDVSFQIESCECPKQLVLTRARPHHEISEHWTDAIRRQKENSTKD